LEEEIPTVNDSLGKTAWFSGEFALFRLSTQGEKVPLYRFIRV
jgi:hypothetical protein